MNTFHRYRLNKRDFMLVSVFWVFLFVNGTFNIQYCVKIMTLTTTCYTVK